MKVAIVAESSADQTSLRLLVDAILGESTENVGFPILIRGYPHILQMLPAVIRYLVYRTDADALLAVVDSNHSPLDPENPDNRIRKMKAIAHHTFSGMKKRRRYLHLAFGMPVPAIEAWLLANRYTHLSEAAWKEGIRNGKDPYTKRELKELAYQVGKPALMRATRRQMELAREMRSHIGDLEIRFPYGFGSMAEAIRRWT